jgi:hypothetical protein
LELLKNARGFDREFEKRAREKLLGTLLERNPSRWRPSKEDLKRRDMERRLVKRQNKSSMRMDWFLSRIYGGVLDKQNGKRTPLGVRGSVLNLWDEDETDWRCVRQLHEALPMYQHRVVIATANRLRNFGHFERRRVPSSDTWRGWANEYRPTEAGRAWLAAKKRAVTR